MSDNGKSIEKVDDIDPSKQTSAVNIPAGKEERVEGDLYCVWNNKKYGEGSIICVKHHELVCNHWGRWEDTKQPC